MERRSWPRIGVFGAGAIGGYLGVRLAAAGAQVTLVGRSALVAAAGEASATGLDGRTVRPRDGLRVVEEAAALREVEVCLCTVKSGDTAEAGRTLAQVLGPSVPLLSVQNGLDNAARLRAAGVAGPVLPAMIVCNVVREGPAAFRKASGGGLFVGARAGPGTDALAGLAEALRAADEPLTVHPDVEAVQAGKLLLNLNNGVSAVTGLSIRESIASRDCRRAFACCLREGLRVLRAAGLQHERVGRLAPGLLARLLPLPDAIVLRLAPSLLRVDPQARSSTLQDLERGKPTEIDFLNGEIVARAVRAGVPAPCNAFVVEAVRRLERGGRPMAFVPPAELRAALERLERSRG